MTVGERVNYAVTRSMARLRTSRAFSALYTLSALCTICASCALPFLSLSAQPSCTVPQVGNRQTRTCTVTLSTSLQLVANAQLSLSSATTSVFNAGALGASSTPQTANQIGLKITGPTLRVSATRAVRVTMVNAPAFSGPSPKSASDVSLGISPLVNVCNGVSMLPLSNAPLAVQQAAPRFVLQSDTPGDAVVRQICFEVVWRYADDPPGSYMLPLTFSITAP